MRQGVGIFPSVKLIPYADSTWFCAGSDLGNFLIGNRRSARRSSGVFRLSFCALAL